MKAIITGPQSSHRLLRFARASVALLLCALVVVCETTPVYSAEDDAFRDNQLLGRGINLGGALEAPKEGDWGVTLRPEYFHEIKLAGFDSVRVPINWAAHATNQPPYTIDSKFFARVDWVVDQALSNGLAVVLDLHHYYQMFKEPDQNLPRLMGLWTQIAEHYRKYPKLVSFELLNEPQGQLTDDKWHEAMLALLRIVRESNPTRAVIIGPGYWNSVDHLNSLGLPNDDRHIIVTFHYYVPMQFTHQGAAFVSGSDKWKGTTWTGNAQERAVLDGYFNKAAAWSAQNERPIYLGEFGAYQGADMESRATWTHAVVLEAEKHGFSWAYWEFCSAFGAYDPAAMTWRLPLLNALMHGSDHP